MARPRKPKDAKRTERFGNPRYTAEEKEQAGVLAAGLGLDPAEYVRRRVLDMPMPYPRVRANALLLAELNRLGLELRAIGNNVNQLARDANAGRTSQAAWTAVHKVVLQRILDVEVAMAKIALDVNAEPRP